MPLSLLAACTLHFGVRPVEGWRVDRVDAPVAEPDVDTALRGAVEAALAARGASGDRPLTITIERAEWTPARRDGDTLVYVASLRLRVLGAAREGSFDLREDVLAPATSEEARSVRAAAFRRLADRAAGQVAAWLALSGV
jgi:hypothetical protein